MRGNRRRSFDSDNSALWRFESPRRATPRLTVHAESPHDAAPRDARCRLTALQHCSYRHSLLQNLPCARENFVRCSRSVDHCITLWIGGGECEVALANAAMKSKIFELEASFVEGRLRIARSRARQSDLLGQVENQREIGLQRICRPVVQSAQPIEIEKATKALIRERGISESIADHDASFGKGRADHLGDMLPPRCGEKKKFRDGINLLARVEQDRSNAIRSGRAAWLFRHQHVRNAFRQLAELRRLTGAFDAFKCDEDHLSIREGSVRASTSRRHHCARETEIARRVGRGDGGARGGVHSPDGAIRARVRRGNVRAPGACDKKSPPISQPCTAAGQRSRHSSDDSDASPPSRYSGS